MPSVYSTIAGASSARRRAENPKAAPLTTEQQNDKRVAREAKQAEIDAEVQKWMEYTNALATSLGDRFDKKPRYFLDIFFQGGAHMIYHQEAVNPYNAFKSFKAAELCEAGEAKNGDALHQDHFAEYQALSKDEKDELIAEFEKPRTKNFQLRRDTPCGRIQDVANVVRNLKMLVRNTSSLIFRSFTRYFYKCFFCIVKNTTDIKMAPEWYFTSKELEDYMEIATHKKWVTGEVGMKLEAFAVAGCD
ncbi:hypothetical protein C8R45DRAFT_828678, partial [Mycena sanguinolenta]